MAVQTKASQVEKRIRSSILRGTWRPGDKLPPEREILMKYNISRVTLRDALNTLAKEGLLERRQGAGTFVAEFVPRGNIAILGKVENLASSQGYFYHRLIDHAKICIPSTYREVLWVGDGATVEEFVESIKLLDRPNLEDTIGTLLFAAVGGLAKQLEDLGIHVVAINMGVPLTTHAVVLDYQALIEVGKDYLLSQGYDDFLIFHLSVDEHNAPGSMGEFLRSVLARAVGGDTKRLISIPRDDQFVAAYSQIKKLWSSNHRPRAIFFLDDVIADVALRAVMELKINVPEELKIITHANTGRNFYVPVPLTRIEFDPVNIMTRAWKLLEALITNQKVDQPVDYVRPIIRDLDLIHKT
jgi:hypothetical protein